MCYDMSGNMCGGVVLIHLSDVRRLRHSLLSNYEEASAAAVVACENDWLESTALDAAIESTF